MSALKPTHFLKMSLAMTMSILTISCNGSNPIATDPIPDVASVTDPEGSNDKMDPSVSLVTKSYYPQLNGYSDSWWDQQAGDNNQFKPNCTLCSDKPTRTTTSEVKQIYSDLSKDIFGRVVPMSAGYAYDTSYYKGFKIYHTGIDIDANNGEYVRAAAPGTVAWISREGKNGDFIAITSSSGAHRFVYGHLYDLRFNETDASNKKSVKKGDIIGKIKSGPGHLHFEVRYPGPKFPSPTKSNRTDVLNKTRSPLQVYWLSRE